MNNYSGSLLEWMTNFLRGRTMKVVVGGEESSPIVVTSPSVLTPVLFLIYMNFVVENFTCKYNIFADDLKIYIFKPKLECLIHLA